MKRLKKAYLEITDICNLACPFCHGTKREKRFMPSAEFRMAAKKLKPYTDYIYLHLMGEPLIHPELEKIIGICRELGFHTAITTNGVLLPEKQELLTGIYKLSVSVHSFEANFPDKDISEYLNGVLNAAEHLSENGTICVLRLWNSGGADTMNAAIEKQIRVFFPREYEKTANGCKIKEKLFIEYGEKFDWPDINADEKKPRFCMGLRDQLGILCDGTVVPCCLDADGIIPLGNIFYDDMEEILHSPAATELYNGFSEGRALPALCRRCGFAAMRFGSSEQ